MNQSKMALENELQRFHGTERYYKVAPTGLRITDGVHYLAREAYCSWLITDIAAVWATKFKNGFYLVNLDVQDNEADLTFKEDTNTPILYKQHYKYTDFPLDNIKFYLQDGVLMLPGEY